MWRMLLGFGIGLYLGTCMILNQVWTELKNILKIIFLKKLII